VKILFLAFGKNAGFVSFFFEWINALRPHLDEKAYHLTVLLRSSGLHAEYVSRVQSVAKCLDVDLLSDNDLIELVRDADLVHAHSVDQLVMVRRYSNCARRLKPLEILLSVHSYRNGTLLEGVGVIALPFVLRLFGVTGLHLLSASTCSQLTRAEGWRGLPQGLKVFVFPLSAGESFLGSGWRARTLPIDKPIKVVYVANMVPLKRHERLIRKLDVLLRQGKVELILPGKGPCFNKIKKLVIRLGLEKSVTLCGFIVHSKMQEILDECHLAVFVSRSENSPLGVMEALASGLPTISTPVGCVAEVITEGFNGYILPMCFEAEHLRFRIFSLVENQARYHQISRNARRSIEERYSWGHCARRTAEAYLGLIGDPLSLAGMASPPKAKR
jgi:glycosyltransferase involved in cell wall biosynthesis